MASLVLTVAGSTLGHALLPGIGGAVLGGLGAALGHSIDNAIFGGSTYKAPRLDNLKIQDSAYGNAIPVIYGRARVAGNVIWASSLIETLSTDEVGGKGGATSASVEKASYALDCAIALGEGPVGAIKTIWADGKVVYSDGAWKEGTLLDAEFYLGTSTQNASPLMESYLGAGNVPAYRGVVYVALHHLQLGHFGNRLPNFSFEVVAAEGNTSPSWLGETDPALMARPDSCATPAGLPPIILAQRGDAITKILAGGITQSGSDYRFTAIEYDVSGNAPVEQSRVSSAALTTAYDLADLCWCASPDGKRVAFFRAHSDGANPVVLALYDVATKTFGALLQDNLGAAPAQTQLAWLDDQRFLVNDTQSSARGVRLYAASGITPILLGFYNVWGAGSSSTRFQLSYAHYAPLRGGLLAAMANAASAPTILYGRALSWAGGTLAVGSEQTITSGISSPVTITYSYFIPMNNGEVVLVRSGVNQMRLFSFLPGFQNSATTRGWTALGTTPNGAFSLFRRANNLAFIHQPFSVFYYKYGEIRLDAGSFAISAAAQTVSGSYIASAANYFNGMLLDNARILICAGGSSNAFSKVALLARGGSRTSLDSMVGAILTRAGYSAGDYDVTPLQNYNLDGYVISDATSARAVLEPLQTAHGFDLIESDGLIKAQIYNTTAVLSPLSSEARAVQDHHEPPPFIATIRAQEQDLPQEVVVDYSDAARDYQRGTQRAKRLASASRTVEKIQLPVICGASFAKAVAETQLYRRWAARDKHHIVFNRRYMMLDAGDVIALDNKVLRIEALRQQGGLISLDAVPVVAGAVASNANAEGGNAIPRRHAMPVDSYLFIIDGPLLRSSDDQPGYYVGLSGRDGWAGGTLFRATDNINFSPLDHFSLPLTCGVVSHVLPSASHAYLDRANRVTVSLLRGTLSSCTDTDLLNGVNSALVGDELIQFQNATLNSDGSYTLSQLVRGKQGTENAVHILGERFILLQTATLRFMPLSMADRGQNFYLRAVTTGQNVSDLGSTVFTPQLALLQPLAPAHVTAQRNSAGDIMISWKRRARKLAEWVDNIDVPLDEDTELYDAEIYNGPMLVRSFVGLTSTAVTYSAAQQVTDFGALQNSVAVKIYQVSSRAGRGAAASKSV